MAVCKTCGWWSRICKCKNDTIRINTNNWITQGEWEHIDPKNPHLRFNSKEELLAKCAEFGVMPRAFMRRKSQGNGWEIQRRTRA